ncbi:MAG: hypothetical protein ABJG88_10385 [Litorimonas sp.]
MAAKKPHLDDTHAEAASGGLPQLDFSSWAGQIFWLVVIFAILYVVLAKFILPKLGNGLAERSDHIADDLDAASRFQQEATEAEKAYTHALADARAKAQNVAETTRKSVDAEVATELEAAEAEAAKQTQLAEARIKALRDKAMSNIDGIAEQTANEIYTNFIGKAANPAKLKAALKAN